VSTDGIEDLLLEIITVPFLLGFPRNENDGGFSPWERKTKFFAKHGT
jgi:hypothetical protein